MEDKIELTVLGISQTTAPYNTFALVLKELYGNRSIPIIIGVYEAQSIALEIEKTKPPRPLAHDIIKELINATELMLTEVLIYDIKDGTYFTKLIFFDDNIEIECRPSDAVAIAIRCGAPIYATYNVLEDIGIITHFDGNNSNIPPESYITSKQARTKLEQLQLQLERAIKIEDYEAAAKIRDEIKLFLEN